MAAPIPRTPCCGPHATVLVLVAEVAQAVAAGELPPLETAETVRP